MVINAKQAVDGFGKKLIGLQVITEAEGGWPGGLCEIISLGNKDAPEIVLNVKRLEERTEQMIEWEVDNECGVFEYETIEILHPNKLVPVSKKRSIKK